MFEGHFGLRENPFVAAHQTRYIYPSPEHQEALAHLRYGIENREPFVLITGEVGTGKTTALFDALSEWEGRAIVGLITNSSLTRAELLEEIALRLGLSVPTGASKPHIMVALEQHLLAIHREGHRAILLLDEAQNLERELLEEIRLLSNLEAGGEKLVQIFLVGQPELEGRLALPDLRQLRQRIAVHYRLRPLGAADAERYIHHRIAVAGGHGLSIFPPDACHEVYRLTHGIPREMNHLCSQAMISAFVDGSPAVTCEHVRAAAEELEFQSVLGKERRTRHVVPAVERRQGPTVPGAAPPPEREIKSPAPARPTPAPGHAAAGVPVRNAPAVPAPSSVAPPAAPAPGAAAATRPSPPAPEAATGEVTEHGPPAWDPATIQREPEDDEDEFEVEIEPADEDTDLAAAEGLEDEDDLADDEDFDDEDMEDEEGLEDAELLEDEAGLEDAEPFEDAQALAGDGGPETGPPRLDAERDSDAGPAPAGRVETSHAGTPTGAPTHSRSPLAPAGSGDDWKSLFKSLAEGVESGAMAEDIGPADAAAEPVARGEAEPRFAEAGPPGLEQEHPAAPPAGDATEIIAAPMVEPAASSSAFAEALRRTQAPRQRPREEAHADAKETPPHNPAAAAPRRTPRRLEEEASFETLPPRLREKMARDAHPTREPNAMPTRLLIAAGILIVVIAGAALAQRMFFAREAAPPVEEVDASPPEDVGAGGQTATPVTDPASLPARAPIGAPSRPAAGTESAPVQSATTTQVPVPPPPAPEPASTSAPAPTTTFALGVGTYLNETRAQEERTKLSASTAFAARVTTVREDNVAMYRVMVGSFPSRTAAERAASDLISRGLVDEARVIPVRSAGD